MKRNESGEELKGFKNKYERIIKHLDIGYFKADANGIILDHNPSFGRIFGYEPNESLVGLSAIDLWANPEDFNNYLKEITEKGRLGSYIHKARKKNGETIILHTHSHVYKNKEEGDTFQADGTVFDVTEKYILEQKLKESEKNYRNIIENAQDAIVIFGLDGNLKYISPQLSKILGREIELGTRAFDGIHPDDEKVLVKAFKKAFREKGIYTNEEFEFRAIHNDGHYIWLSSLTKNYYDDEGNLDGFIALLKDITDKKEAQRKLLESEQKYRNIIENSKDAIIIIGLDGEYKYISPQLSKMLGREINLETELFADIHPEDLNNLIELLSNAVKQKSVLTGQEVEFRTLHNDGYYIWLSSSSKNYYDENGNIIGFIILLRDVTDKKEAEQELKKSEEELKILNRELEQKVKERTRELEEKNLELTKIDKVKDDFITMAAHELKTPLISIAGYTDYILTKHIDDLTVDVKNDLLIVQRNIKRLQTLINQLLDVIKIESDKIDLNLERRNISNIIYSCLHELNYLFKEKNHEMILNIDNEIFLNVDSNRIFQVFSNLISNATKFTQKGGRIEITAKKDVMHYLFEIKDNGIGLPEKDLERIFEMYETIEQMSETYNQTSSGIGLYISKKFIEAHGGKMWATSEGLNKGMTIHFTIPI